MKVCSVEGCNERFSAKGLCRRHWKNARRAALRLAEPERIRLETKASNDARRRRPARTRRICNAKRLYSLTTDQYLQMEAERNGMCDMCGITPNDKNGLCVDHDHSTGAVRSLVCPGCNAFIGMVERRGLSKVLSYLRRYAPKT